MIPTHLKDGRLPEGIHPATWTEVAERFGTSLRRQVLLAGLHAALWHLHEAGCRRVWIGGSFVRGTAQPGDVDVVWDVTGVDPYRLHAGFLSSRGREWTKAVYAGEYFPSHLIEASTDLPFVAFFQRTRDDRPCGVVVVELTTLTKAINP
jgi:hypothetical protein